MQKRILEIFLFLVVFIGLNELATAQKDQSGPTVTAQSNVYQIGNKWYCPLCRKEVPNADRSDWDLRLQLSEWHDVLIEKDYFNKKIRYISDEELVNNLDIPSINSGLKEALNAKNYDQISKILYDYFSNRRDDLRISLYDHQNKKFFCTPDIFIEDVKNDTARYNRIMRAANTFYSPDHGYVIAGEILGKKVDFNRKYERTSKHGVHGLGYWDDEINYFLLKKDTLIPEIIEDFFNQWFDQLDSVKDQKMFNQPVAYDPVWYELGLAVRQQRVIDAYRVFAKYFSPETGKRFLKIILGNARWLEQCVTKTPFHPYNWQTHSAMSVSYTSCTFPEFKESAYWDKISKANMRLHFEKDIFDDGGYVERTPGYAEYMFSVYYRYILMLKYFKNDNEFMDKYLKRIEKCIEFFVLTNAPTGVSAPFNDAHRNKNMVKIFKEMGEFFNRPDFIGAIQYNLSPDVLASLKIKPRTPDIKSIDFPNSKFVVMRESWDPKSYFMITNYGEFQNHSHYDHIAFEIFANGKALAVDAGIGKLGYMDPLHVPWFKHPSAHNMITINQAIPEKMDKFGYDKIWSPLKHTEYFAATHDGYLRYQKTKHRRHIIYSKNSYWFIVDEIFTNEKGKEIDFNLHTPCDMKEISNGFISNQENGFLILSDEGDASSVKKIKSKGWADLGDLDNEAAYREIDWLIFRKESNGKSESDKLATLILPFETKSKINMSDYSVEKIVMNDKSATGYRVKSSGKEDVIIISDGKYRKFMDSIEGDFKFGFFSYKEGILVYSNLSNVKKYKINGDSNKGFPKRRDFEYQK